MRSFGMGASPVQLRVRAPLGKLQTVTMGAGLEAALTLQLARLADRFLAERWNLRVRRAWNLEPGVFLLAFPQQLAGFLCKKVEPGQHRRKAPVFRIDGRFF